MLVARSGRLFNAIVVVGVSLTGGTLASCGETASTGDVDAGRRDNVADSGVADSSLADRNVADSGVADRRVADDYYTSIVGYGPDAYARDSAPPDAASVDACYSCIHPIEPDAACAPYDCIAPP